MSTEDSFLRFHAENPAVYEGLVETARKFRAAKQCRYLSFRLIWEYYRATKTLQVQGDDEFSLNNNWVPYYTRLLMAQEPDLQGCFRTRKQRTQADEMALELEIERELALPDEDHEGDV